MDKSIRRITIVQIGGGAPAETIYVKKAKKRRTSKFLKPVEREARRLLEANQVYASELLNQHNKSVRKRKDGWLRDLGLGQIRAWRRSLKKLTDD